MQAAPDTKQQDSIRRRFSKVTLYTLLCFAMAGLIAGFALGVAHNKKSSTASSTTPIVRTPSIAQLTSNALASPTVENIQPAEPLVRAGDYAPSEIANGTASYTFAVQIMDKSTNAPIQANDVTCRLWLTRDAKATQAALSADNYALLKTVNTLNQPLPAEEEGALNFTGSTSQVQACATTGKTTWTYSLSPDLEHGAYYLVVLADWRGVHYNWYMTRITIENKGNN